LVNLATASVLKGKGGATTALKLPVNPNVVARQV